MTGKGEDASMAGVLVTTGNESVTLPVSVVRKLEQRGDGDAALLYLALLRHRGAAAPRSLAGELRWERERIERAEAALGELGLITVQPGTELSSPEPAEERPEYTPEDIAGKLEGSGDFRGLTGAVEQRLGKRLTTPDLSILLGLYDYLGLPADVIYLLVCHCAERVEGRYGPGRRPGMKQIQKEGYAWARLGIDSQEEAAAYLKRYSRQREAMSRYMRAMDLPERKPSPTEEKYMIAWQEMGFGPEAVAIAYDRTILRCQKLEWKYLNGILKKWHEAGLHTPEEIEAGDRPLSQSGKSTPARQDKGDDLDWMRRHIRQRDKHREG